MGSCLRICKSTIFLLYMFLSTTMLCNLHTSKSFYNLLVPSNFKLPTITPTIYQGQQRVLKESKKQGFFMSSQGSRALNKVTYDELNALLLKLQTLLLQLNQGRNGRVEPRFLSFSFFFFSLCQSLVPMYLLFSLTPYNLFHNAVYLFIILLPCH